MSSDARSSTPQSSHNTSNKPPSNNHSPRSNNSNSPRSNNNHSPRSIIEIKESIHKSVPNDLITVRNDLVYSFTSNNDGTASNNININNIVDTHIPTHTHTHTHE
eukprot:GHVR01151555.1.p1 GENE.GHVR01151555.1~~GHVR01151555.1.p1  ORF type:complete len:105 (+),score=43.71 GHVR01151555.1:244-558(+)